MIEQRTPIEKNSVAIERRGKAILEELRRNDRRAIGSASRKSS